MAAAGNYYAAEAQKLARDVTDAAKRAATAAADAFRSATKK
jgi:hypothetical protein